MRVAESGFGFDARAVAAALPLWLNEKSWMVSVTLEQFVGRTGLDEQRVRSALEEVLESPFAERENEQLEFTLFLKLPK